MVNDDSEALSSQGQKVEMGMVVTRCLLAPNLLELIFSKKRKLCQVLKSEKGFKSQLRVKMLMFNKLHI